MEARGTKSGNRKRARPLAEKKTCSDSYMDMVNQEGAPTREEMKRILKEMFREWRR